MTILIDADGCPVVDLTLQIAKQFGVPVIILCDTAHQIEREGAQTLVLNQNGLEYTADNIDALMLRRYGNKKLLRAGKHPKGSPKRTKEQDVRFADTLEKTLSKNY